MIRNVPNILRKKQLNKHICLDPRIHIVNVTICLDKKCENVTVLIAAFSHLQNFTPEQRPKGAKLNGIILNPYQNV
jgi:hypothetical protein